MTDTFGSIPLVPLPKSVEKKEGKFSDEELDKDPILKKLISQNEDPSHYIVDESFAIYKGNNVNYRQIKLSFVAMVEKKLVLEPVKAAIEAEKIGVFLNLGGFSTTRKNQVRINDSSYSLDEITKKLDLVNYTKTSSKSTDREFVTLTRVCISYADSTRAFIKLRPHYSKFSELKDLGFVYSWACSGLSEEDVRRIYIKQLDLMTTWVSTRTSNPKRFPEKMELYYSLVLNYSRDFFSKIREEYEKSRKITLVGF